MNISPTGSRAETTVDGAIVGGGIAGLWVLNVARARGYRAVLFEAQQLGCAQTLASQGMIHGGIKYALSGNLTGASEAIAEMPSRWRACLAGQGEVDLNGLKPLSERYHLFAQASTLGKLTGFFASKRLRGRISKLKPEQYPPGFGRGFNGVVYELKDFVIDASELLQRLRTNVAGTVYQYRVTPRDCALTDDGVQLTLPQNTVINARALVFAAGKGNRVFCEHFVDHLPPMQTRPLHQVIVRHAHREPVFAHCLTGITQAEPRLTITSHRDGDGWLWYLGGQLATQGIDRSASEQIQQAQNELARCVPWLDWRDAQFESLLIDRAEPKQSRGRRPEQAFVGGQSPLWVCWPTKLSLAPDLGARVLARLPEPIKGQNPTLPLPPAVLGDLPWST